MVDLGALGGRNSYASAVRGDLVVGSADTAAEYYRPFPHAAVWDLSAVTGTPGSRRGR